ncbi:MAG: DNA polymerase III subunit gamma/tau [Candidatus Saccharimonadales bacterium]
MGQALYRKYRSKSLDEVVGQEHITTTLKNAISKNKISHAYLFTGPKGVGKTSVARILAYEINNIAYDEHATHLDIIEIDAASNRRIDEIRELRDKIFIAPSLAKYKVYIIDEVHMLTKEAFNALLKTLEEPPAHAVFILATTESHKLPETIISRTQRFTFKPIDDVQALKHLQSIAKKESIDIDTKALQQIVRHGNGSFRDSISLLDQLSSREEKVTLETVETTLGIAPKDKINDLKQLIGNGSPAEILTILDSLQDQGYECAQISRQLSKVLRDDIIFNTLTMSLENVTFLLDKLLYIPASIDPKTSLELVLFKFALESKQPTQEDNIFSVMPDPKKTVDTNKIETLPANAIVADIVPAKKEPIVSETITTQPPFVHESWQLVLEAIKKKHNTLYSVIRMGVATIDKNEVTISFKFPFHQKRINDAKNKQIIANLITELTGNNVSITCVLDKTTEVLPPKKAPKPVESNSNLETINNIFGGSEVLES